MSSDHLLQDLKDGVLTLTLNRPNKKNAITIEMMRRIESCLVEYQNSQDVKAVVVTGTGNIFSAGADFNSSNDPIPYQLNQFRDLIRRLIDFPKILVAVVNGPAIGMACTMLALFDLVFASVDAYLQTPFSRLGLVAEGCSSYTFPRIFGGGKASRLLYLNEKILIQEAYLSGFVTKIFPQEVLHQEAGRLINDLVSLPMESVEMTKRMIRRWDKASLHQANDVEVESLLHILNNGSLLRKDNSNTPPFIKNKL